MTITGNFADFSLPELLQFLDHGKKTGVIYIEFLPQENQNGKKQVYYFWLHQGRIVAVADRLDQKSLTLMIAQRGWISERVISRVTQISSSSIITPMGLFLKSQGLLQSEQLKLLFNSQVLRPICNLFQVQDGEFKFDTIEKLKLPLSEMTGLSMSATEVILIGLRALRDWTALADKLPDQTSGLSSLIAKQPQIQLNALEWQVWEFVNGNISLQDIANQLRIPVETVQQIAYRLIVIGLADEHFMVSAYPACAMDESTQSTPTVPLAEPVQDPSNPPAISRSFLKNLVDFLSNKA
ncbi:MAG: DUF4388 domain-containing protein [Gloeotrichia echinulata GP01]